MKLELCLIPRNSSPYLWHSCEIVSSGNSRSFFFLLLPFGALVELFSWAMTMSIAPISSVHTVFTCEAWSPKVSVFILLFAVAKVSVLLFHICVHI